MRKNKNIIDAEIILLNKGLQKNDRNSKLSVSPPLGHFLSAQRKISSAERYVSKRLTVEDDFGDAASFNEVQGRLEVFIPSTTQSANLVKALNKG